MWAAKSRSTVPVGLHAIIATLTILHNQVIQDSLLITLNLNQLSTVHSAKTLISLSKIFKVECPP